MPHIICTHLDANLERIPDGEVSSGLMEHVIHLNGSLIHKVGGVELVVVMESDNPLCHPVHVWLVGHMVRFSTVENLPVCLLWKSASLLVMEMNSSQKFHLGDAFPHILFPPLHFSLERVFHHTPTNSNVPVEED